MAEPQAHDGMGRIIELSNVSGAGLGQPSQSQQDAHGVCFGVMTGRAATRSKWCSLEPEFFEYVVMVDPFAPVDCRLRLHIVRLLLRRVWLIVMRRGGAGDPKRIGREPIRVLHEPSTSSAF